MRRAQAGLGPNGGANETCQWGRVGKGTDKLRRTPPGSWPVLQGTVLLTSRRNRVGVVPEDIEMGEGHKGHH